MNEEELNAFEKELAALRPRDPSPRVRAKLDAMVDSHAGDRPRAHPAAEISPTLRWRRMTPWLAVAAGLAFAAVVFVWRPFVSDVPQRAVVEEEGKREVAAVEVPPTVTAQAGETASEDDYKPVKALNSLRNRIDDGLVTLDSGLSARQYRFQFVDTVVWENTRDGSQFEVSTPREEIVLVPVHTF